MTHYPFRLPVDNADLPADLHCKGRVCQDAFDVSPTNLGPGQFWQCPGRREQATVAGKDAVCPIQGFRYPRKRTIDEEHHGRIKTHFHQGIDLGHGGQSVYSVVKGRVAAMRRVHQDSGFGGYGRTVLIRGRTAISIYTHISPRFPMPSARATTSRNAPSSARSETPIGVGGRGTKPNVNAGTGVETTQESSQS